MLYDDPETQFVSSRLVLNPTSEPPTPTGLKQAQPASTPSSSPTRSEPYPIGKQATLVREESTARPAIHPSPNPSFLLNKGAEYDPLLDDAVALCRKIKSCGGRVRLDVIPGMTHGFLNLVLSNATFAASAKQVLFAVKEMFGDV
eukprot:sb/3473963/